MEERKIRKPHPKEKFSKEEDFRLRTIVFHFGDRDWNLVASMMNNRNPRQCKERWMKYLSPDIRFDPWLQEEDFKLQKLVEDLGFKWTQISKYFKNRTDINVKNRWMVLQRQKRKKADQASGFMNSQLPIPILTQSPDSNLVNEKMPLDGHIFSIPFLDCGKPFDFSESLFEPSPMSYLTTQDLYDLE